MTQLDHIVQMEMAVVGAVIEYPDRWAEPVFSQLPLEQFGHRVYQLASIVYGMWSDSESITAPLVMERLRTSGVYRPEHGPLILDCCAFGYAVPSVDAYIKALADTYLSRRLQVTGHRIAQMATDSDVMSTVAYLSRQADEMQDALSDRTEDETMTLADVLAAPEQEPEWLVPGLLTKGDRLLVVASEGAGKSVFLRQIALAVTLGVDPFEPTAQIEPRRTLLIDCEVSRNQLLIGLRRMHSFASRHTHDGKPEMMMVESRQAGLDLCDPTDQAWLLRMVRMHQPEVICMGPLYRMTSGDINDEITVRCWQRVLEPLIAQGISLVMEHHAPQAHDNQGRRYLRPIGSSVIRRWFAQGIALRTPPCEAHDRDFCRVCQRRAIVELWRGSRDETQWPNRLRAPMQDVWWLGDDY